MEFLKGIGGKLAGGLVALAVIIGAISWFRADPQSRHAFFAAIGQTFLWIGLVAVLPWATFFIIAGVARVNSNAVGAALVFTYIAFEITFLVWLFGWKIDGAVQWTILCVGGLLASAYNVLTCDWIAEKLA